MIFMEIVKTMMWGPGGGLYKSRKYFKEYLELFSARLIISTKLYHNSVVLHTIPKLYHSLEIFFLFKIYNIISDKYFSKKY